MAEISIIVPVYNVEKYIRRCIDSLIAQTFKSIEILLIDDGSTDNSGTICDEYALIDDRIKVIHKANGGVSSARNVGLDNVRGRFIMFCDPDDYVAMTWCERMYGMISQDDIFFCSCGFNRVSAEDNSILDTSTPTYSLDTSSATLGDSLLFIYESGLFRPVWNNAFRAQIIYDNSLRFRKDLSRNEDTVFVLEYLLQIQEKVGFINEALYNYSVGIKASLTQKTPHNFWESELLWLRKLQQLMCLNNIEYCAYRKRFCSHIIYAAISAMQSAITSSPDRKTMFKRGTEIITSAECKEAFKYGSFQNVHPLYKAILQTHCFTLVWFFNQVVELKHQIANYK